MTGKLALFGNKNLIDVLPLNIARLFGLENKYVGWLFILAPVVFSVYLKRSAILVASLIAALLLIAKSMPANSVWYSENFMILIFILGFGVAIELHNRQMPKLAYSLGSILSILFVFLLTSNFGTNKSYPWNENTVVYRTYQQVGESVSENGVYTIETYSQNPVRIRMCEIGIVSYFSGRNGWIYDLCGLAQVGNLRGATESWLRFLTQPVL